MSKINHGSENMIYIVRYENKILCFYHDGKNIMLKHNNTASVIFNDARRDYSINISSGQLNLFCQNNFGNIFLCTYKNNNWQRKIILQNQFNYPLRIYPLIDKNNFSLLYNMPANKNNFYLVINKLQENRWQPSIKIDELYGLQNFCVQRISDNHLLVFYMTKTDAINLGYREITSTRQSDFHLIHSTYYKITDTAFLTTNDSIHILYTVKNMFTKQIVYCKKQAHLSKPMVLFENPNITNNLLFIVKNELYALWTINEKIYIAVSKDNGFTFHNPIVSSEFFANIQKAVYLSDELMHEENFFYREIYVDKNNPWQIKLDIQKNFAQTNNLPKPPKTSNEIINKLKNQLEMKERQLAEKNNQILNLTNLLKNKNDEIISLCSEKKSKKINP